MRPDSHRTVAAGRCISRGVTVILALSLLSPPSLTAQVNPIVLANSRCTSCRIVADSMGYLGFPEEDIDVSWMVPPARNSRGQIFVSGNNSLTNTAVFVFDSAGRLLQTLGRQGAGPGEFRGPIQQIHIGPSDTIHFFEPLRVHIFDADRMPVRSIGVPRNSGGAFTTTTILADGRIVRATAPNQITILAAALAGVAPQVQVTLESSDTTCSPCGNRSISRGLQAGTIWSTPSGDYLLEQHDLSGKLLLRLQRSAPWFQKWGPAQLNSRPRTPAEGIALVTRALPLAVRQGADGLIWVFMRVVDPDTPIPTGIEIPLDQAAQNEWFRKYSAVYVEVIDPASRQVLATRKFKSLMVYPIGDGYAARVDLNSIGGGSFTVLRLHLVR